jgi:hypothetical protein
MPLKLSRLTQSYRPVRSPSVSEAMTPQRARAEAERILSRNLSPSLWQAIDRLTLGGVLSSQQICAPPVTARTLRNYAQAYLITRIPYRTAELQAAFEGYGLPFEAETSLYVLGPVGLEIAKQRHPIPPITGHLAYPLARVMHDVIVNEIILQLSDYAEACGWEALWWSEYEAALRKEARELLKPDGLLQLVKGEQQRHFLIEYHNEDHRTRAERKVMRYETIQRDRALWQDQWETDAFPLVLAVFHKKIVAAGYQEMLREQRAAGIYYGKTLSAFLKGGLDTWGNLATRERDVIFPTG